MEPLGATPGTVSRILWHFTGGPNWNAAERRQNASPKPAAHAYSNLLSILKSRELRLGSYQEVVRVRLAERRKYHEQQHLFEVKQNVVEELASSPVCCLADVPIIHLSYLAPRYGKFAIGFHRDAVVKSGFNPVFYALEDANAVWSIYEGFGQLANIDSEVFRSAAEYAGQAIDDFVSESELDEGPDLGGLATVSDEADALDFYVSDARESFTNFLGLVKTFAPEEFGTIYCEREWRSLTAFKFRTRDIAMVVLPRSVGKAPYYEPFTRVAARSLHLPRTIPVVPWEDLIEH